MWSQIKLSCASKFLTLMLMACVGGPAWSVPILPGGQLNVEFGGLINGLRIDLGSAPSTGSVTIDHLGPDSGLLAREIYDFEGAFYGAPSKIIFIVGSNDEIFNVNEQLLFETGSAIRPFDLVGGRVIESTHDEQENMSCWTETLDNGDHTLDCIDQLTGNVWLTGGGVFWHSNWVVPDPKDLTTVSALAISNDTSNPIEVTTFSALAVPEPPAWMTLSLGMLLLSAWHLIRRRGDVVRLVSSQGCDGGLRRPVAAR